MRTLEQAGPAARRAFEREVLYGEATETVAALVKSLGISQRELAERLGLSEARVSRILNGHDNVTLRTLADLGWALGVRFTLVPEPLADRAGSPAESDPEPPEWLAEQRRLALASSASRSGFDRSDAIPQRRRTGRRTAVHTVKTDSGWLNKLASGKVLSSHRTKAAAAKAGRKYSLERKVQHVIHNEDGSIREENSSTASPRPQLDR